MIEHSSRTAARKQQAKRKITDFLHISLIVSITLHITMVIVAIVKFDQCLVEPKIPIFLLVEGLIGFIAKLVGLFRNILMKYINTNTLLIFLSTAGVVTFILGSFYIFKEFMPSFDPDDYLVYCDKTVYIFSLIYVSFYYVILLILISGIICFVFGLLALDKWLQIEDEIEEVEEENPTETVQALK